MSEIYFENISTKIADLLNKAENEIYIAVAWITNPFLINTLSDCLDKKIKVNIIFYNDNVNKIDAFEKIFNKGAKISYSKKLMHNKFCIIDNYIVINGSYNWTNNAEKNHENIQVTKSKELANKFILEFKSLSHSCEKIDKYYADNNTLFYRYYNKLEKPKFFPCFYRFELTYPFNYLFPDPLYRHIYVYIEDLEFFKTLSRKIYNKLFTENRTDEITKFDFTRGPIKKIWNEELKDTNNEIIQIERTELYHFHIYDFIINPCSDFKLTLKDYISEGKKFTTDKFVYLKKELTGGGFVNVNLLAIGNIDNEIHFRNRNFLINSTHKLNLIRINLDSNESFKTILELENYDLKIEGEFLVALAKHSRSVDERTIDSYFDLKEKYVRECFNKRCITNKYGVNVPVIEKKIFRKYFNLYFNIHDFSISNKTNEEKDLKFKKIKEENDLWIENELIKYKEIKSKECYIATMVYGDVNHYKLDILRNYRDTVLINFNLGRMFIKYYYKISPFLVENFNNRYSKSFFKLIIELILKRI